MHGHMNVKWDHLFQAAEILGPPDMLNVIPMTKFEIKTDKTRAT